MEPIARATFHRAICNWQPSASRVATFVPPLERHVLANRRAEFGAFKMHKERVVGSGRETTLKALEVIDHDGKIKIMLGAMQPISLELTGEGPKLFDTQGKERKETVCFDGDDIGIQMLRKIVNCITARPSPVPVASLKLGYFVAEKSAGTEWRVIAFAESIPSTIMDGGFKTFIVLTTEDLSGMMKRVNKGEVVFCPPVEMIEKPKLEHVIDEGSDNPFAIKSYFRCQGIELDVSTVQAVNGPYPYETMVFVGGNIIEHYTTMYKTQEEARLSHWKLIARLRASETEDVERIARFIRFM